MLSDPVKAVCIVKDIGIRQSTEFHEIQTRVRLFGNVDPVLTDCQNSVWSNAGKVDPGNDLFTQRDIIYGIEFRLRVMALSAHRHIFCSCLYLGGWYQTLLGQIEE